MKFMRCYLVIFLFVVSCGDDGAKSKKSKTPTGTPEQVFEQGVAGTWLSGCESTSFGSQKTGLAISSGIAKSLWELYSGTNCAAKKGLFTIYTNTDIGAKSTAITDAYAVSFAVTKVTLAIYDAAVITKFNKDSVCGKTTWKINEEMPIDPTAANCVTTNAGSAKINLPSSLTIQKSGTKLNLFTGNSTSQPYASFAK